MQDDVNAADAVERMKAHIGDLLAREGYRGIEADSDGDIRFKAEGRSLVVIFTPGDPGYLRLALPNFWPIDDEDERNAAYRAANMVTLESKCVAIFVTPNDNMWATVEWLTTGPEAVDGSMLVRLTEMILAAALQFRNRMQPGARVPA